MTSKTHFAVGIASAVFLTMPENFRDLILCLGTAGIGSVISDVDATTSESKKGLKKVILFSLSSVLFICLSDKYLKTDIVSYFRSDAALTRLITGILMLITICVIGEKCPHRTFMHSLPGTALTVFSTFIILPSASVYMLISMLSHILLDMTNKKKIRILYPLKKPKIGFGLFYADRIANKLLFIIGSALSVLLTGMSIYFCIHKQF